MLLALLFAGNIIAQEIAYIESDRNWHRLYDAKGKLIKGFARSSVGEVVGWGSTFFVGKNTGFYRVFDVKGRVTASQSIGNVGDVLSVSSETITSRKGSWILQKKQKGVLSEQGGHALVVYMVKLSSRRFPRG